MKVHLDRCWENGLVFKIAWTKILQNFLVSNYDIKQQFDATVTGVVLRLSDRARDVTHALTCRPQCFAGRKNPFAQRKEMSYGKSFFGT